MRSSAADLDLASALRISVMRLSRRMRWQGSDESLSTTQLAALGTLLRHGPMSPTALAEHERVQPPSMTRVLGVLEERELVLREPHATDRRQSVIAVTPAGKAIIHEDRRRREAWLGKQLQLLSPEEREALRRAATVLEKLSLA
jgi:DNA-binding MarR family transcriptional regulator